MCYDFLFYYIGDIAKKQECSGDYFIRVPSCSKEEVLSLKLK